MADVCITCMSKGGLPLVQRFCKRCVMMTTEHPSSTLTERRQFVRVQDAIGLHIQRLTDMPAAGQVVSARLPNTVRKQDKYDIDGYAVVRRDYPDVAKYIDDLEERIRQLLLDGDATPAKPTHKVNLSAGGIYFSDSILLRPGELIGLTMIFFPSGESISVDAQILEGNEPTERLKRDEPSYRAIFVRMTEDNIKIIERHVQRILKKSSLIKTS